MYSHKTNPTSMNRVINKLLAVLLIPSLLLGCVKETEQQQPQEGLHEVVFHAGWAPETKTVLQEDGSVWWSPGDEISLFAVEELDEGHFSILGAPSGWKLVATNDKASSETTFEGLIDNVNNVTYYAVYPYNTSVNLPIILKFNNRAG